MGREIHFSKIELRDFYDIKLNYKVNISLKINACR